MRQLSRYQPSQQHRDFVKRSGFDFDHPDRRVPVRNQEIENLLNALSRSGDRRKSDLLRHRSFKNNQLVRSLIFGTALLGVGMQGDIARAADTGPVPPEWSPPASEIAEWFWLAVAWFRSLTGEVWIALATLSVICLLLIQTIVQIRQTRALRNRFATERSKEPPMTTPTDLSDPETREPRIASSFSWSHSCASRTGKMRSENQDRYETIEVSASELVLIECDGAGGHAGGAEAAELATATIRAFVQEHGDIPDPVSCLTGALNTAKCASEEAGLEGITTAVVAWLRDDWLHFASLGDGNLAVIWPDGMVSQHLTPHHNFGEPKNRIAGFIGHGCTTSPRVGSVRLEPGCQVVVMSDGAGDLFPYEDYARQRHRYRARLEVPHSDVADQILGQLENARHPDNGAYYHQDNMTLLMATLRLNDKEEV